MRTFAIISATLLLLASAVFIAAAKGFGNRNQTSALTEKPEDGIYKAFSPVALYEELNLIGIVDFNAFELAIKGFHKIENRKKEILVLIDFTKPSTAERLFVIDVQSRKLLYSSVVAHGRNSGGNYATEFSNQSGSHKSSLGFYITDKTYVGKNGYSLLLDGLEKGFNDKARERAIVMHGADYCDRSIIKSAGRLGRSFGCPALPREVNKQIIDTIKEGAVMFIYAADQQYARQSPILAGTLAMN